MNKEVAMVSLYLCEENETLKCNTCNNCIKREETAWLEVDKTNMETDQIYCEKCKGEK